MKARILNKRNSSKKKNSCKMLLNLLFPNKSTNKFLRILKNAKNKDPLKTLLF